MLSRYVVSQVKHNSYFLVGLALGLWVSLSVVPLEEEAPAACGAAPAPSAAPDEFEPQREERPLSAAARAAGRSVQRPRYYSTELGMRGSLLTGVLSSEEALRGRAAALNRTAARLPALRFFIAARAMGAAPGLPNVVGFTDTREMLKPFHALKYLADNYLEEYDFFFLVSDAAFVNARRLTELVSRLSVSQDVYMGTVADGDSQYCSLDGGILLSNSVLRSVHSALDWCVRNSYSPHHHENIGRCVLHAHRLACTSRLQGESYQSVRAPSAESVPPLSEALADAVTVAPVTRPEVFHQLHAFVSRVHLERDGAETWRQRGYVWRNAARHPPHYRNATWPGGLRADPGLAPPLPDTRFDHLRWVAFNRSHMLFPDDHREVALIAGPTREALDLVVSEVSSWAVRRWAGEGEGQGGVRVELVEGAWRWEPAAALRYRLLLRLRPGGAGAGVGRGRGSRLALAEAVRALGAARLVPVRYVTESARVALLLPVRHTHARDALAFLQRYEAVCLAQDKNTALLLAVVGGANDTESGELRAAAAALAGAHRGAQLDVFHVPDDGAGPGAAGPGAAGPDAPPEHEALAACARRAADAALGRLPRDALLLVMVPHAQFNQDFLNRVRMNTISGEQWFLPSAFGRYALYDHPRFLTPSGAKPSSNTGRFNLRAQLVLAFYRADYEAALSAWRGARDAALAQVLAGGALRCVRAPEPALVLEPRPAPCAPPGAVPPGACARALRDRHFAPLDLGARHSLAQLLLETQADLEP